MITLAAFISIWIGTLAAYFGVKRTLLPEARTEVSDLKESLREMIDRYCQGQTQLIENVYEEASRINEPIQRARNGALSFLFASSFFGLSAGITSVVLWGLEFLKERADFFHFLSSMLPGPVAIGIICCISAFWFLFSAELAQA